jgi:hypothetical protein
MSIITETEADGTNAPLANSSVAEHDQKRRIMAAIGVIGGRLPRVNGQTLSRYFRYLSARLSLPFAATYPEAIPSQHKTEYRCTVVEVLDPTRHIGDELDGIFCKTRHGSFEVNLPLIELEVAQDNPNFQLIEDYWYWFWNWR